MKQIIQSFRTGETILEEVPVPKIKKGCVLIKSEASLVSAGTERMLVEFGKANLLSKAKQQPERVRQVLDKIKIEGFGPTINSVLNKLDQPIPLGYCNVGRVLELGDGVSEYKIGDRVISNGPHAEYICIPKNLVALVPDKVSPEEASFTVIGSVALQGIRLLDPDLGETIVVIGLGLIGLLAAEILKSNGCRVIGIEFDPERSAIAREKGIITVNPLNEDVVSKVLIETNNVGADGVIITASSKTNEIISQSARMSRQRGRIILIGVVGLNINRSEFYQKELTFQVSCSYGPGRYDENYEGLGHDYPIGFVRWTEKRNFEAVLNLIENGQLNVKPLISRKIPLDRYNEIYSNLSQSKDIASILEYSKDTPQDTVIRVGTNHFNNSGCVIGIIGAGNFTSATLLPSLKKLDIRLKYIASASGLTAKILAKKGGFQFATSDYTDLLNDKEVNLVLITTRHNLHAKMVTESLNAGKNVFVEKPLALNHKEIESIVDAYKSSNRTLTVGFNRRFAPLAEKMKNLAGNTPKNIIITVNAGMIPQNSWVHDLQVGGGRIIGEACHFIDFCTFLTGSKVSEVCMNSLGTDVSMTTDNATILLKYEDGSNAVVNYFANGSKSYPKERVEIFNQERILILENWRKLTGYGFRNFTSMKSKMDKGHHKQFKLLAEAAINNGAAIIPMDEIINTSYAGLAALESLQKHQWVSI